MKYDLNTVDTEYDLDTIICHVKYKTSGSVHSLIYGREVCTGIGECFNCVAYIRCYVTGYIELME